MIAFGPVPSRRLGRSLGINNIPPKICSYSCVYCQLGNTHRMKIDRLPFYRTKELMKQVEEKVGKTRARGGSIDYLAFVPDGEPTLDARLGAHIRQLRKLGIKIAVICNSALLGRADVREDLAEADWVSLKIDAVEETLWRRIDRPHKELLLDRILDGVARFAADYGGVLVTETMLVHGLNDAPEALKPTSDFITTIDPTAAYLSIPTRPPAESWCRSPDESAISLAYHLFNQQIDRVELLIGYEGNAFAFTGDVEEDLLSITSVHPMREEAVIGFLKRANADWSTVDHMLARGRLVASRHDGHRFYIRRLNIGRDC